MNPQLRALLERKQKAIAAAKAINDKASAEKRDLTDEERTSFDAHMADVAKIDADIVRQKALIEAERSAPALPAASFGDAPRVEANILQDPRRGFASYGQFARAVMAAGRPGGELDERLAIVAAAPTTYGNEVTGADGGYLVPPEYSREVFQHSLEGDALLPLTDNYPVAGNTLTFPRDETTPWGTDGMRAYWETEAGVATQTKPKGSVASLRTNKLMALVPVTDELMADTNALEAYIGRKTAESIRWKTNLAFFQGNGVGQPTGMFGHACQVSVAKEVGQAADSIVAANVAKMYGRMVNRQNAIWMINDDALQQVMVLSLNNNPIWIPPSQGFKEAPNGFLLGRPIMITQLCKTVGDKGDIVFANWKYYRTITKAGAGIETATSMHLYFDAGATAFRATFRVDGMPSIAAAVSPANGSNTLSPFVTLDDRT
jgi:HK97 family phage major capsid protein